MESEAEYNLLLGLARTLAESKHSFQDPIFLATIEKEDTVRGCAFRTPPYKIGLTQMPLDAIPLLVDEVQKVYESLPAVLGPESAGRKFAQIWSRRKEIRFEEGVKQRIFQLSKVDYPDSAANGEMILANAGDVELATDWLTAFQEFTGLQNLDPGDLAEKLIEGKKLFLWVEDGIPKAMAGITGGTANGSGIGYVFTPRDNRDKGYATTLTADLSQELLDSGKRFCFLYTDLSNPTSNSIYQKIGYRPVADVMDFVF